MALSTGRGRTEKFFARVAFSTIRFFAEFTLRGAGFFATLRMTRNEGLRMTNTTDPKCEVDFANQS